MENFTLPRSSATPSGITTWDREPHRDTAEPDGLKAASEERRITCGGVNTYVRLWVIHRNLSSDTREVRRQWKDIQQAERKTISHQFYN